MQREAFKRALEKVRENNPLIHAGIAWNFVLSFEANLRANRQKSLLEQQPFGHLIRLTLNEAQIGQKSERTMYAALIGYIYGVRGNAKKKRARVVREKRNHRAAPQPQPSYEISSDAIGQLGWKL